MFFFLSWSSYFLISPIPSILSNTEENTLPSEEVIDSDQLETRYFINNEVSTKEAVDALDTETIESMNVVKDTLSTTDNTKINRVEVTLKPKK